MPEPLVNMAIALYAMPRHVMGDGIVCEGRYPTRGIAPGCHWAMPLAKVYILEPIRQITACNLRRAKLDLYVDDILISAEGSKADVIANVIAAGQIYPSDN